MKKLLALVLLLQAGLYALYQGNPAEPQLIDQGFFIPQDSLVAVKVGYQGDWVFDRKLKAMAGAHGEIDRFYIFMNQGVATFNMIDRIELYLSVGSMDISFAHRPRTDHARREYWTHDKWTAGGGLRILLMQWKNTCLGVDGKCQYAAPGFKSVTLDGDAVSPEGRCLYREWQVSFAFSHTVDIFTPYIGATYSNVHAAVQNLSIGFLPHRHFKLVNPNRFGLAVGCSLCSGKKVDLNFEARLFDEQAATVAGNVKF
jgi:hypothetical protein